MKELERKTIKLEIRKKDVAEDRARLGEIVEDVAKARRSLQLPKGIMRQWLQPWACWFVASRHPPLSTAPPSETLQTAVKGSAGTQLLALRNKPIPQH